MNKLLLILFLPIMLVRAQSDKVIARQGQVSFFSYTSVEHIKAQNNQVLSVVDLSSNEIAVRMLMNAFVFEKALMRDHFNESYIESDIYPEGIFEGKILDFDSAVSDSQTRLIKGVFSMHGVQQELEIKTKIEQQNDTFILSGTFQVLVQDYNINIPPLLAGNIAKTITVDFRFEYEPYEN